LEPIIHGFYSSSDWKKDVYQHRMAKLAEMDMAVAGVLRVIDEALKSTPMAGRRILFALGNATFRTGVQPYIGPQHVPAQAAAEGNNEKRRE
jgi:hypothetical protein